MIQPGVQTYILSNCFSKTKLSSFFQDSKPYFFCVMNKTNSVRWVSLSVAVKQSQIVKYVKEELRAPVPGSHESIEQ